MELHNLLVRIAQEEGIPLAGTVDLDLVFSSYKTDFEKHVSRYDEWLQLGYSGAMEYLARGRDRRANPQLVFPEAKSVFCVAFPYPKNPAGCLSPEQGPRYARYLQGPDYHKSLKARLETVMLKAQSQWSRGNELRWKVCVDTSAVLERTWAALAGLGWIGKNTLLIHPKYGSYLFLAEVFINQNTGKRPELLPNYCGNCTRCMKSCPTQALEEPHLLNSNRCISYLTLEKKGDLAVSSEMKKQMQTWIAGCDLCQEACPFNIKPSKNLEDVEAIQNNATQLKYWEDLIFETEEEYKVRVKNSALNRIKPMQFKRNLLIALKNGLENNPDVSRNLAGLIKTRLQPSEAEDLLKEFPVLNTLF